MDEIENKRIFSFLVNGKEILFKEPLMLDSEFLEGELCLKHKELGLCVYGPSWTITSDRIREQLQAIWEDCVLAPVYELSPDAVELRKKLLAMVVL